MGSKYDFQHEAVDRVGELFKKKKYVLFMGSCGVGKTHIIAYFARKAVKTGSRVLIIAGHQNDLKNQFSNRLQAFGHFSEEEMAMLGTGGLKAGEITKEHKVIVSIPQAICHGGNVKPLGKIDYIIIDEAHINVDVEEGGMIPRLIMNHPKAKVLLVTATGYDLMRSEGFSYKKKDVGVIDDYDHPFAVKKGVVHPVELNLQQFEFEVPKKGRDAEGELTPEGRSALKKAFKDSTVVKKVLSAIIKDKKSYGDKILIIVPPGDDLYLHVVDYLSKSAGTVARHSDLGEIENETADLKFRNDPSVRFCVVVYKNGIGWDFPELDTVIDMTLTQNHNLIAQRAFRACRISKLKPNKKPRYVYLCPSSEDTDRAILILSRTHWLMSKEGLRMDDPFIPHDPSIFEHWSNAYAQSGTLSITHRMARDIEERALAASTLGEHRSLRPPRPLRGLEKEMYEKMISTGRKGDLLLSYTDESVGFIPAPKIGSTEAARREVLAFWDNEIIPKYRNNFSQWRSDQISKLKKKDRKSIVSVDKRLSDLLQSELNKVQARHSVLTPMLKNKLHDICRRICGLKTVYEEENFSGSRGRQ